MYRSFTARNFRCFRDLTIEPLERVNLIAGMNNTGKTSLLEALFLHMGPANPDLSLRVNVLRGIEQFAVDPKEIWGWLFYGRRVSDTILLTSLDRQGVRRDLQMRLAEPSAATLEALPQRPGLSSVSNDPSAPKPSDFVTTASSTRELTLDFHDSTGRRATSRVITTPQGIRIERGQIDSLPLGAFLTTRARFPAEDAERYSNLARVNRQNEVLDPLRTIEPRLSRLEVLVTGGVPMISGDLGMDELIPTPLMGEGTVRLLSLLLAILAVSPGFVLIDEIENGLHHSVLVDVWRAIAVTARRADTQVFATTHSWECIRAAQEAFATSGTYDMRLHRLDRVDGDIHAVTYDQETLATSVEMNLEVR